MRLDGQAELGKYWQEVGIVTRESGLRVVLAVVEGQRRGQDKAQGDTDYELYLPDRCGAWHLDRPPAGIAHYDGILWLPEKVRLGDPDPAFRWLLGFDTKLWSRYGIGQPSPHLVDLETAAAAISVVRSAYGASASVGELRRWAHEGRFPTVRRGQRLMVQESDLGAVARLLLPRRSLEAHGVCEVDLRPLALALSRRRLASTA